MLHCFYVNHNLCVIDYGTFKCFSTFRRSNYCDFYFLVTFRCLKQSSKILFIAIFFRLSMLNIKTVVVTKCTVTENMTQKAVLHLERDYKNSFEGDTKLSHE